MGWQNSSLRLLPCIRALGPLEGRQPAHLQPAAAGGAARSSGGSSRVRSWGRTRCLVPQHCAAERQQLWLQRHRPVGGRYGGSQGGAKPQARSNGGGKSTSAGPAPPMAAAVHACQSQLPAAAPSSPHELPWPWVGEVPPLEPLTPVGAAGPAASRSDRGSHSSRAGRSRLSTVGLAPASQIDCGPHLQQPTWEAASRRQLRFENSRA